MLSEIFLQSLQTLLSIHKKIISQTSLMFIGTGNGTSSPFNIRRATEMGKIVLTWSSQEDDFIIDHYKIQLDGSEQPILVKERKYIFPAGIRVVVMFLFYDLVINCTIIF